MDISVGGHEIPNGDPDELQVTSHLCLCCGTFIKSIYEFPISSFCDELKLSSGARATSISVIGITP